MDIDWSSRFSQFERAKEYGFHFPGAHLLEDKWFKPKPGSHDDGPFHGPFLGPLGGPNYSRDFHGQFSRWHLQPGVHLVETIPQASFLLYVKEEKKPEVCRCVGSGDPPGWDNYTPSFPSFPESSSNFSALFPVAYEHYNDQSLPVELLMRSWSPLTASTDDSAMPVLFFSFLIRNRSSQRLETALAHFWPNLLGWKQGRITASDRGGASWPGQTHSGNRNFLNSHGVIQTRRADFAPRQELEGELFLGLKVYGKEVNDVRVTREACFKADQNALGIDPAEQKFTQGWVQEWFAKSGTLPETGLSWEAHWHEPLSSALAATLPLEPGECCELLFIHAWDLPFVTFGAGRSWKRKYTSRYGTSGRNSKTIAQDAFTKYEEWNRDITEQSDTALASLKRQGWPKRSIGALLNERFFLTGGGTAWLSGEKEENDLVFPKPRLDGGEHFGILEGFDTGYYYYNTFDLWIYAFPALTDAHPHLVSLVFDDYLRSISLIDDRKRPVYRLMECRSMLLENKIPHDVGNPMEDPWHELNGYTMRDDPNVWRDHNPGFIISFFLYHARCGRSPSRTDWEQVKRAFSLIISHDEDGDGLPEHKEFGDSTWDALAMRGVSCFSGGLSLAAYSAVARWANLFEDEETEQAALSLLEKGSNSFEKELWNGRFYRTDSAGRYRDSVMIDGLIGPFYADLSGLKSPLPPGRIKSHLRWAYELNFLSYNEGKSGPLLVSDGSGRRFSPDGGEELQINEVLIGSAWLFTAMLFHYGLKQEAFKLSETLSRVLYQESGLQFRTPAAWDGEGNFRAPLNMRPLSSGIIPWL